MDGSLEPVSRLSSFIYCQEEILVQQTLPIEIGEELEKLPIVLLFRSEDPLPALRVEVAHIRFVHSRSKHGGTLVEDIAQGSPEGPRVRKFPLDSLERCEKLPPGVVLQAVLLKDVFPESQSPDVRQICQIVGTQGVELPFRRQPAQCSVQELLITLQQSIEPRCQSGKLEDVDETPPDVLIGQTEGSLLKNIRKRAVPHHLTQIDVLRPRIDSHNVQMDVGLFLEPLQAEVFQNVRLIPRPVSTITHSHRDFLRQRE